jgi:hypothetical protein
MICGIPKLAINRGQRAHAIRVPATGHWLWGWSEASDSNPDSSMSRRVGESSGTMSLSMIRSGLSRDARVKRILIPALSI